MSGMWTCLPEACLLVIVIFGVLLYTFFVAVELAPVCWFRSLKSGARGKVGIAGGASRLLIVFHVCLISSW